MLYTCYVFVRSTGPPGCFRIRCKVVGDNGGRTLVAVCAAELAEKFFLSTHTSEVHYLIRNSVLSKVVLVALVLLAGMGFTTNNVSHSLSAKNGSCKGTRSCLYARIRFHFDIDTRTGRRLILLGVGGRLFSCTRQNLQPRRTESPQQ